jgi:hypothetical protein
MMQARMRQAYLLAVVVVASVVVFGGTAFAQDAHVGTWKQNPAKSKTTPAPTTPAPQSVTRTYEVFEGDGIKVTYVTVSAEAKRTTSGWSAHFDGKDYPYTGSATVDTIALKRIDASTFEYTTKKAGKVTGTGRNAVSKDGKTMTTTSKGTNAQGQPTSGVVVWDKQ